MSDSFVIESPVDMIEGESRAFNLTIPDSPTITGTPAIAIYNQETNTSATNLSATTGSASGSVVTTSTVQSVKGGETYFLHITATVDGRTDIYLCEINVLYPWGA